MKKTSAEKRSKFSEAIDPRFTGVFQNTNNDVNSTKAYEEKRTFKKEVTSDGDQGLRDFLSKQLFDYMESHIKIVDIPEENLDLCKFEIEEPELLPGVPFFTEESIKKSNDEPPKKKKKKKNKEKESFKEVAVSAKWLENQAKLFNT